MIEATARRTFHPALATALVLCSAARATHAEPRVEPSSAKPAVATTARPIARADLLARYRRARVERNVGWALGGLGIALAVGGAVTVAYSYGVDTRSFETAQTEVLAGAAATAVGLAFVVPGIILAIRGQNAMTDLRWRLNALPVVAATRGGFVPSLRFFF